MKPLKPHAIDMLRLIAKKSVGDDRFWSPDEQSETVCDRFGATSVFVYGSETTGAIRTLTSRGLVELVDTPSLLGSWKWCRRITPAGRAYLDALATLKA